MAGTDRRYDAWRPRTRRGRRQIVVQYRDSHPATGEDMNKAKLVWALGIVVFGLAACDRRWLRPAGGRAGGAGGTTNAAGATGAGGRAALAAL